VISGRQLHGQEALTNQSMYYAQIFPMLARFTTLKQTQDPKLHGVPIPVRCTVSQSPCGARCPSPVRCTESQSPCPF